MTFQRGYGRLDRVLYRLAFRAGIAQRAMADVEELLFGDGLGKVPLDRPVLITALPRSGTTILLRILADTGHFATHTYRDMPFLLAPLLWHRLSRHFAVEDYAVERAHGDGLQVSPDSAEAFEEMIWKEFWPEHYRDDSIRPWRPSDRNREFEEFLESHMRKIITLRRAGPSDDRRYLSKNNLNFTRLAALPKPFCAAVILVPFRDPIQHAASMLRQHRRFLEIHEQDDFVRVYMEAIGHHEFGKGVKPVDFAGWLQDAPSYDGLEFWVRYWIAAYRFILDNMVDSTRLISYARFTEDPESALRRIAEETHIPPADLVSQAGRVRPPRTHDIDETALAADVREEAAETHERLDRLAVV